MSLNEITVVILSRNREEALRKTLMYWAQTDIRVTVLHNTQSPLSKKEIPQNVEYVVLELPYGKRCAEVKNYLRTKYAILSSDDEVFLPSALREMRDLISASRGNLTVGGTVLAIGKYGREMTATLCYRNLWNYSNDSSSSEIRIRKHFDRESKWRSGAIYRLMTKELMLELMQLFSEVSDFQTPYIYEVSGEILINAKCKVTYVKNVYWIRNWMNEQINHKNWDRSRYFHAWYRDPAMKNQVTKWSTIMGQKLNISNEEFEEWMIDIEFLRMESEKNEISKLERREIHLPSHLKYLIRSIFVPRTLPMLFRNVTSLLQSAPVKYELAEIRVAAQAIQPKVP